jgi:hypothetical protein
VLDAATDPELTDDESLRVRERLAAAGLLAPVDPPRARPAEDHLASAKAATEAIPDCRTAAAFDGTLRTAAAKEGFALVPG